MFRLFIIISAAWRFGLDDIALSVTDAPLARFWRRLNFFRFRQPRPLRLRLALEHLGPIFVKFGQLLSTRRDLLPGGYIEELEKLQDAVPPAPDGDIEDTIHRAYGEPLAAVFSEFDMMPVGSASVAQVHRAQLAADGREVAVKILRAGIGGQIRRDLKLLDGFARLADVVLKDSRRLKPRAIVAEFSRHLTAETDLLREAANCAQIGRNFSGHPALRVPEVYWQWCAPEVMVMEYLPALPVSRIDEADAAIDKKRLASTGIELFFTQVFRDNFFHADMHPGNVHVDDQGRFVLLDYGIVGYLTDFDKEYLMRNFLAFFNRDYRRVAVMHVEAGWVPPDTDVGEFEAELRTVCEPIFAQPLKNISFGRFLLNMFQTARKFNLEVQPQLILLQKTLFYVEGMGRQLDPDINIWDTAKPVLEQWSARQNHPREILAMLKQQVPDWRAVLKDLPGALRQVLQYRQTAANERQRELAQWQRRAERWRAAAIVFALAALTLAGGAAVVLTRLL